MKIDPLFTRTARTLGPAETLSAAAHQLWEGDCGIVPVVDEARRLVGVITDRDICMAALFRGAPLGEIRVADAMARQVLTLAPGAEVREALELMRAYQVRRLPVVDEDGGLLGMLSLADLARAWAEGDADGHRELRADEVAHCLAGICRGRQAEPRSVMVVEITPPPRTSDTAERERPAASGKARAERGRSKHRKA